MSTPTKDGFEGFMEPFQEPVCPIPRPAEVVEALDTLVFREAYCGWFKCMRADAGSDFYSIMRGRLAEYNELFEVSLNNRENLGLYDTFSEASAAAQARHDALLSKEPSND